MSTATLLLCCRGLDLAAAPCSGLAVVGRVEPGAKPLGVERGEGVAGAVHATRAVAAPNDRDELASLLMVVSRGELDERLLR